LRGLHSRPKQIGIHLRIAIASALRASQ